MTQDELRRLMGAYATGSLSDAERKALFEAALDDQDLFDELAREQAIRETIAEPGARDRLIARLATGTTEASPTGGWRKGLAWGLAASFVLSMSIAAVVIMRSSISPGHAQLDAKLETPARPSGVQPTQPSGVAPGAESQPTPTQQMTQPAAVPRPAPVPSPVSNAPAPGDRGTAREKKIAVNGFRPVDSLVEKGKSVEKPAESRSGKENDNGRLPAGSPASASGAAAGSTTGSTTGSTAVGTTISPAVPAPVPVRVPAPAIADLPVEARRAEPARKDASQIAQAGESAKSQDAKSPPNKSDQVKAEQDKIQSSNQVQVTASAGRVEQSTLVQSRDAQANRIQNSRDQTSQPASQQARSIAQLQPGQAGAAKDGSKAKTAPAGLIGGGIGGGGGGRGGAAARPAHFAFDYLVSEAAVGEELTLKFAADGYISIHFVPGGVTVVGARVSAGSTRRERIPNNATEIDLLFTASQQAGAPGASITREPKDARSGSAEDPGGARIDLLLRLY